MTDTDTESVDSFRARARTWLAENFPRDEGDERLLRPGESEEAELAGIAHARDLQRMLYDGGCAGVCFPTEYGGLGLLRTNWDVPKHRGLSVFIIKIHQPGVELHRIEMINGSREFCQEFLTDLRVPDSDRVGEVDQGWTVGTRWMFHEKNAMGGGSPYVTGSMYSNRNADDADPMVELARATGHLDDPRAQDMIGESYMLKAAQTALSN